MSVVVYFGGEIAETKTIMTLGAAVLTMAMGWMGWVILRASNEEWEHHRMRGPARKSRAAAG